MQSITTQMVKERIHAFLDEQYKSKAESVRKKLMKAEESEDTKKITEFQDKISGIQEKYQLDTWMNEAATRMVPNLGCGSHTSKGVHPFSKGDTIAFQPTQSLPSGLVGSQHFNNTEIETTGNAAYLPVAAFFDFVVDEEQDIRIRHLIVANHPALKGVFASDPELSEHYRCAFQRYLLAETDQPATSEKNKQIFWLDRDNTKNTSSYTCLIPLYPALLTNEVCQKINGIRFSEENMAARKNRSKKDCEQKPYQSFFDLAAVKLGGSNAQNAGLLVKKRGGRDYLLPSFPPTFKQGAEFRIGVHHQSFFHTGLRYHCSRELLSLFAIIKIRHNTVHVRTARTAALESLIDTVLMLATNIQNNNPAGWTRKLRELKYDQKLWLDPKRALLEGEEEFAEDRIIRNWQREVEIRFANWVNDLLKKHIKQMEYDFGDAEQKEWRQAIEKIIKQNQRQGLGVFL